MRKAKKSEPEVLTNTETAAEAVEATEIAETPEAAETVEAAENAETPEAAENMEIAENMETVATAETDAATEIPKRPRASRTRKKSPWLAKILPKRSKGRQPTPRRWFLPAAFLLVIFAMCFNTYGINIGLFYNEIGKVADGAKEKNLAWYEAAEALVEHWTDKTTELMAFKDQLVELHGLEMRLLNRRFVRDTEYSYSIVKDNHDWLQFITFPAQPREIVRRIDILQDLDIPILYVQPPTKHIEGYTEFPVTLNDYSDANVAQNFTLLEEAGVPYLDLRAAAEEDGLDKEQMFYRTDHHWRVETAFWAVGRTVQEIEELFGWQLDPEGEFCDIANWQKRDYGPVFLGSQGRRVGPYYGGVDEFTLLTPSFETRFQTELKQHTGELKVYYGDFITTIIDNTMLTEPSIYTNRYGAYWGADYPTLLADNLENRRGITVLLIKDSYGLPFGAFLATMVDKLYMVDLRYYNIENLSQYVQSVEPDLILIMYC